jgi:3-phenylpropionate/trans-cinnamate dioxygenase ferredoxin subunit
VQVGESRIALCRVTDGTVYAIDDVCTHDGAPLKQGELDDHAIECPRHGARFDVRDGHVLALPALLPVETYEVTVQGDEVKVRVQQPS